MWRRALLSCLVLLLIALTGSSAPPARSAAGDGGPAIWVAHTEGLTLVGGADGALLRDLALPAPVAIATDARRERLWVATATRLLALDAREDQPRWAVELGPAAPGHTLLAVDDESIPKLGGPTILIATTKASPRLTRVANDAPLKKARQVGMGMHTFYS